MKDLDKEVDEKMKKIKEINEYWKKQVGLKEKLRTLEEETIFVQMGLRRQQKKIEENIQKLLINRLNITKSHIYWKNETIQHIAYLNY